MHWAKTHIHARYNIGASGVQNYPLRDLPVRLEDLEITGDSFYGYGPLQEAIARHTGVDASRVVAALGTSQANHLAMAAVLRPGDEILLEEPSYELIASAAAYLGATVRRFPRLPEGDFAADPDDVCRRIGPKTRLVAMTNLHNPTSALSEDRVIASIAAECERRGAFLLVDEAYLESAFDRDNRSAALLAGNVIATNSLTKVYGLSGLRCGWVLASPELAAAIWRLRDLFESIPPHVSERLSVIAFSNLGRIRARARALIDENRATARSALLARVDVECYDPGIGTVLFPRLAAGGVDRLCDDLLRDRQTLITPGRFFGMDDRFRIGLGGDPEMFREGMKRLCAALDAAAAG